MEEYLRQVEHNIAASKELIRQSNELIDQSVVWLAALRAHRPRETGPANHARMAKRSGLKPDDRTTSVAC